MLAPGFFSSSCNFEIVMLLLLVKKYNELMVVMMVGYD